MVVSFIVFPFVSSSARSPFLFFYLDNESNTDIDIGEYQLDLIPFDEDVLSLELNTSFRDCLLVCQRGKMAKDDK